MQSIRTLRTLLLACLLWALASCTGLDAAASKIDIRLSPAGDICGNYTAADGQLWEVCYNPLSKTYTARYGGLLGKTYALTYDPASKALVAELPNGTRLQFIERKIAILPATSSPGILPVAAPVAVEAAK